MSYEDYEEEYDPDMYEEFGEGFEDEFDAVSEKAYEQAFAEKTVSAEESDDDFEFDSIVGGRDKKPVMSILNKGKLSKYEMDELLNKLE